MKTILFLVAAFAMSGCLEYAMAQQGWNTSAVQAAEFDHGCNSMRIVAKQGVGRYRLQGCGKQVAYLCENDNSGYTRSSQTLTAQCRQIGGN